MKESIKSFISKNLKWIIVFIGLIVFLAIAEDVFDKDIIYVDMLGYQLVSHMISDAMTPIMKFITNFGGIICLFVVGSILSIISKNKNPPPTMVSPFPLLTKLVGEGRGERITRAATPSVIAPR